MEAGTQRGAGRSHHMDLTCCLGVCRTSEAQLAAQTAGGRQSKLDDDRMKATRLELARLILFLGQHANTCVSTRSARSTGSCPTAQGAQAMPGAAECRVSRVARGPDNDIQY